MRLNYSNGILRIGNKPKERWKNMMLFQLVTIPVVGALIGWVTNILAIKLIFRPYDPVVVPIFKYKIQGLIPKRRSEIAASVGKVVGTELLPLDDVVSRLNQAGLQKKMIEAIVRAVTERMNERIPPLVPSPIKKMIVTLAADTLHREAPPLMRKMVLELPAKIKEDVDFAKMVEDKINSFDLRQLERIILDVAASELRHIEVLGAILGFLIGLVQAVFIWLLLPV
ncbi:MAG: DUF445 domain-containing protein [Bacillota bacterium]|nr:DUF445 family protein [Clostridia bacterium]